MVLRLERLDAEEVVKTYPAAWCKRCNADTARDQRARCQPCRERELARKREAMSKRYRTRVAARVCCECEAKLADTEGVRCEFCADLDKSRQLGYRRKPAHRKVDRERSARLRAARRAKGLCQFCNTPSGEFATCEPHRIRAVKATNAWKERKRLGAAAPARATVTPIVDPSQLGSATSERDETWAERVLYALRRLDWSTSTEIAEALDVTDPYSRDRNSIAVSLRRLVEQGLVERRQLPQANKLLWGLGTNDYRITDAGRAHIRGASRRAA